MAGTFLQSFMICLQRLDQSGSPVRADEGEKSDISPDLTSPPTSLVGHCPPRHVRGQSCAQDTELRPPAHCREHFSATTAEISPRERDQGSHAPPTPPPLTPAGWLQPPQSPTWIILLEVGEVHVGVEDGGDGGELAQLLVLLPALQTALVVGQPVTLALRRGRRGGRGGGGGRAAGPGALGLAVIWAEEATPFPEWRGASQIIGV